MEQAAIGDRLAITSVPRSSSTLPALHQVAFGRNRSPSSNSPAAIRPVKPFGERIRGAAELPLHHTQFGQHIVHEHTPNAGRLFLWSRGELGPEVNFDRTKPRHDRQCCPLTGRYLDSSSSFGLALVHPNGTGRGR